MTPYGLAAHAQRVASVFLYWELDESTPTPPAVVELLLYGCVAIGEL